MRFGYCAVVLSLMISCAANDAGSNVGDETYQQADQATDGLSSAASQDHSDHDHSGHDHGDKAHHEDEVSGTEQAQELQQATEATTWTPSFCMDRGEFAPGEIKAIGEDITVEVMSADPEEAIADNNRWVVAVSTKDGPLEGAAAAISVAPMMPDHGHGTPIVTHVTALDVAGQYELSPVNLFMPGYWVVNVEVDIGDEHHAVKLNVCVEQ